MEQNSGTEQPSWEELLGSNNWEGLVEPLDLSLRKLLLKCGDMCQVTADSFISDDHSQYNGKSRYGITALLDKVFFPYVDDYRVKNYLYAVSRYLIIFRESNWMGYIAVSKDDYARATGRREIYVVWRGAERIKELIDELLKTDLVPFDDSNDKDEMVMRAWHDIYTTGDLLSQFNKMSAKEQVLAYVKEIVEQYKDESLSIVFAGHGLGGTLAILSAFDIVKSGLSKIGNKEEFPVCAMVFGSPKVGNQAFKDRLEKLPKLRVLHVKNKDDSVPKWPDSNDFVSTGKDLFIDSQESPYLKAKSDYGLLDDPLGLKFQLQLHDLQVILHTVAWYGEDGKFDPKIVKRSLALVNKQGGYLKDVNKVLEAWWVEKNKGMVVDGEGQWYELPPLPDQN